MSAFGLTGSVTTLGLGTSPGTTVAGPDRSAGILTDSSFGGSTISLCSGDNEPAPVTGVPPYYSYGVPLSPSLQVFLDAPTAPDGVHRIYGSLRYYGALRLAVDGAETS